jgi:hypothetical protein
MKKLNILVFPCGSEIGLEIHRSLKYSTHINLFGANSTDDHGKFVYKNYIGGLPFINDNKIIGALKIIVDQCQIDAIYPAMDKVIWKLKKEEMQLGCKVISANIKTLEICLSKRKTYKLFKDKIKTPKVFARIQEIDDYPVFIKPDIGYGSRGTFKANCFQDAEYFFEKFNMDDYVISEYLPYEEYTVDCFSNREGKLLFVGPRQRNRIMNGISVNTRPENDGLNCFYDFAKIINEVISFNGAWFFQVKKDKNRNLTLLEVASRLGGSSALFRARGINFALLSVFDAFNIDIEIIINNYDIELDRALDNKFRTSLNYSSVYVDFDDCLIVNNKINKELVAFLFQAFTDNKKIILISKHDGDLQLALKKFRLDTLFDEVIQLKKEDEKYKYIQDKNGIFIDDSFNERKKVLVQLNIPVFSSDMVDCLIN